MPARSAFYTDKDPWKGCDAAPPPSARGFLDVGALKFTKRRGDADALEAAKGRLVAQESELRRLRTNKDALEVARGRLNAQESELHRLRQNAGALVEARLRLEAQEAELCKLRGDRLTIEEVREDLDARDGELRRLRGDTVALRLLALKELEALAETLANALQAIQREHRRKCTQMADEALCIVCQSERRSVVLEPCRHLALCRSCAVKSGDRCPQCRAAIEGYLEVYS